MLCGKDFGPYMETSILSNWLVMFAKKAGWKCGVRELEESISRVFVTPVVLSSSNSFYSCFLESSSWHDSFDNWSKSSRNFTSFPLTHSCSLDFKNMLESQESLSIFAHWAFPFGSSYVFLFLSLEFWNKFGSDSLVIQSNFKTKESLALERKQLKCNISSFLIFVIYSALIFEHLEVSPHASEHVGDKGKYKKLQVKPESQISTSESQCVKWHNGRCWGNMNENPFLSGGDHGGFSGVLMRPLPQLDSLIH